MIRPLLLTCVALAPSCVVAPSSSKTVVPAPKAASGQASEAGALGALERALQGAERKVELVKLEQAIAEMKQAEDAERARDGVEAKEHAAEAAERALALYEEFGGPGAIEAAVLAVDRARSRLVSEQQDLEGILRIYAEEEEATAKDEIIRRHRVAVEFAERGLAAAEKGHEETLAEVAGAKDDRRWALEKARREVQLAAGAVERAELGIRAAKLKAEETLSKAQAELDEARRKLEARRAEQGR